MQKAPGSHVVVMSRGEEIPDTTKQEAAELAVIYSSTYKAGTGAKVAVDTTEVKNIWKASGAKPGMVLYGMYAPCSTQRNRKQNENKRIHQGPRTRA